MRIDKTRLCTIAVVAMVAGGSLLIIGYPGWNATGEAIAASAQDKTQARQSLNEVMSLLRAVDTAYASGNALRPRPDLIRRAPIGIRSRH